MGIQFGRFLWNFYHCYKCFWPLFNFLQANNNFFFKFCHQGSSINSFLQADHSLFSVLPPGVRAALPKMWANDVLDHLVIVRVVGVSLSGQRSLVLRPKALNVGAEGPQCLGRRPSEVSARWLDSRVHHTPRIARG